MLQALALGPVLCHTIRVKERDHPMNDYKVELYQNGAKIETIVPARNQREALMFAEARFPGYRGCSAQSISGR